MVLAFIIDVLANHFSLYLNYKTRKKTASHRKGTIQQPFDAHTLVSPSRGSTFVKQRVHQQVTEPSSIKSSKHPSRRRYSQVESDFRQHSTNDFDSKRTAQILLKYNNSPPRLPEQYLTKTMSTTTAAKKTMPLRNNGLLGDSLRSHSSDSNKRTRKLWWSPKRNEIEIRSDHDAAYKNVSAKVNSLANMEYRPGGGQVSIRDEPTNWQAASKVNSLANVNWSPPPGRAKNVRMERLQWNAQPKVDSMANIDYKPTGGGNIAIRDEKVDLSHVTPRVDCGFVD